VPRRLTTSVFGAEEIIFILLCVHRDLTYHARSQRQSSVCRQLLFADGAGTDQYWATSDPEDRSPRGSTKRALCRFLL
jgi:hypothetical protein